MVPLGVLAAAGAEVESGTGKRGEGWEQSKASLVSSTKSMRATPRSHGGGRCGDGSLGASHGESRGTNHGTSGGSTTIKSSGWQRGKCRGSGGRSRSISPAHWRHPVRHPVQTMWGGNPIMPTLPWWTNGDETDAGEGEENGFHNDDEGFSRFLFDGHDVAALKGEAWEGGEGQTGGSGDDTIIASGFLSCEYFRTVDGRSLFAETLPVTEDRVRSVGR